jgi:SNF2 family DNA or RNA helicase
VRNNSELLKEFKFSYIVLDEAQVIKNPHSKTYKTLMGLSAENRLILTGTPIENSLSALWAQMNFLNHGLLGGYEFFNREYIIPVEKNQDQDKTTALKRLIEPFVMRRTKTEVAPELPELSKNIVYCEMTPAHQEFYDTEKSKVRNLLLENMTDPNRRNYSIMVLKSMTRLRLAANHPVLVDEDYADDSGKFETVLTYT